MRRAADGARRMARTRHEPRAAEIHSLQINPTFFIPGAQYKT